MLSCGLAAAEVDAEILALCEGRCNYRPFLTDRTATLTLRRVRRASKDALRLSAPQIVTGSVVIRGDVVEVCIPDEKYAAEAALRVLYQVATVRTGGVLAHSAGVAVGNHAVVALGLSGAGKTTFSSLGVQHGGARLLSDEICAIFPDGRAYGTPFRSDGTSSPTPEVAQLKSLLVLRKEPFERLEKIDAATALPELLGQTYRPFVTDELTPAEAFGRLSAAAANVGVHAFSFRKHPDAGRFIANWVAQNG